MSDATVNVFKCILTTNAYTPNLEHEYVSDIVANELSGNGYARQSLTNVVLTRAAGVTKWDADNPEFLAVGGALTARYYHVAHVNEQTDSNSELVGYGVLDTTPGDVVATVGNQITVTFGDSGIFTGQFNPAP